MKEEIQNEYFPRVKISIDHPDPKKAALVAELERKEAEFYARGGKKTVVPPGVTKEWETWSIQKSISRAVE